MIKLTLANAVEENDVQNFNNMRRAVANAPYASVVMYTVDRCYLEIYRRVNRIVTNMLCNAVQINIGNVT